MLIKRRGLSIVEFMVGIAVGLFVVGGSAKLFVDYLSSNRRGLLETRVNQDLRAAADLIARDLRRAGYWRNASTGLFVGSAAPSASNPYGVIVADTVNKQIDYRYAKDANDAVGTNEQFGIKADGALRLLVNGAWQPITDPEVVVVTAADLTIPVVNERVVDLYQYCPCLAKQSCTANSFLSTDPTKTPPAPGDNYANRPRVLVREYEIRIVGRSPAASDVVREIRERVRPRNDLALGVCP